MVGLGHEGLWNQADGLEVSEGLDRSEGPAALGGYLKQVRSVSGDSLRSVGDATGFSPAYLLKIERGEVKTPSPHLLKALSRHFSIPYATLMRQAGYPGDDERARRPSAIADAIAGQDLSEAEQRAILAFIASLRAARAD